MSDTRGGESVRVVSQARLGCTLTMGALQGGGKCWSGFAGQAGLQINYGSLAGGGKVQNWVRTS